VLELLARLRGQQGQRDQHQRQDPQRPGEWAAQAWHDGEQDRQDPREGCEDDHSVDEEDVGGQAPDFDHGRTLSTNAGGASERR